MYEVTYTQCGIIHKMTIQATDSSAVFQAVTNMFRKWKRSNN